MYWTICEYILQGTSHFVTTNRVSLMIYAISTTVLTSTRSVGIHTHTQTHTHRVPVDNVGNWVLGCCFRLTDSSPFLMLYSHPPPSLSASVSLSFHLCFWFSDTTGIDLCRSEYVVWAALSNWNCTITLLSLATQCDPPLHPAPCCLLPAFCFLLSCPSRAVVWWVSPWESKYVLLFPRSLFHSCFPNKWPIFLMHCSRKTQLKAVQRSQTNCESIKSTGAPLGVCTWKIS